MKRTVILSCTLLLAACSSNDPFSPNYRSKPLLRMEIIRSSVGEYRTYNIKEIQHLPDGLTCKELFDVLGWESIVAPEIPIWLVLPRAGYPLDSIDQKFRYGFYVWPESIVSNRDSEAKIRYITYDPQPDAEPIWTYEKALGRHVIVWPSSLKGNPMLSIIPPALELKEPNQTSEPTPIAVTPDADASVAPSAGAAHL